MTTIKNEMNKGFLHFQTPFRINFNKIKKVRKKMSIQKKNKAMASYNEEMGDDVLASTSGPITLCTLPQHVHNYQ